MRLKIFSFNAGPTWTLDDDIQKTINEWLKRTGYRVVTSSAMILDDLVLGRRSQSPGTIKIMVYYEEK